jgi:hypothetical protein
MYQAYVTRIKNLHRHSNADRLQVGECFGNPVIVGLEIEPDQLGVYFGSDGRLGVEYADANNLLRRKDADGNNVGGYLDPDKRNIKTLKLRSEKSDGLFMPLSSFRNFCDITTLNEGDTITVMNGVLICEKYVPRTKTPRGNNSGASAKAKELKALYPFFAEHADTEQLAYNMERFKLGDRIILTLKMHGTSQRTAHAMRVSAKPRGLFQRLLRRPPRMAREWDYVTGTRRVALVDKIDMSSEYYGDNEFRIKYHEFFRDKLQKGEEVFYEIVGFVSPGISIMPACSNKKLNDKEFVKKYGDTTAFHYGCADGENAAYVYRMTMTNEDGYTVEYPWSLVKRRCEQMGMPHVPEFESFDFTTPEDLTERVGKYLDIPDPVGKTHIAEGVVVRIENREKFTAYKSKGFSFKVLEGLIKEASTEPDIEEAQEV